MTPSQIAFRRWKLLQRHTTGTWTCWSGLGGQSRSAFELARCVQAEVQALEMVDKMFELTSLVEDLTRTVRGEYASLAQPVAIKLSGVC